VSPSQPICDVTITFVQNRRFAGDDPLGCRAFLASINPEGPIAIRKELDAAAECPRDGPGEGISPSSQRTAIAADCCLVIPKISVNEVLADDHLKPSLRPSSPVISGHLLSRTASRCFCPLLAGCRWPKKPFRLQWPSGSRTYLRRFPVCAVCRQPRSHGTFFQACVVCHEDELYTQWLNTPSVINRV